jgi:hypothetical protein
MEDSISARGTIGRRLIFCSQVLVRREEDAFKVDFKRTRMSKPELRKKLASLSFSEKIKILEKLRRRSLAIAANGLRPSKTKPG